MLFRLDAERAHALAGWFLQQPWLAGLVGRIYRLEDERLAVTCFGLQFPNPVGLAAGFDKDATLMHGLARLGFGFLEVGTVTPRPQPGNPRPRLFRLPRDRALLNRMGFNNQGVEAMARRLAHRPDGVVLGVNIGKNRDTPLDQAAGDYLTCFRRLHPWADYFVVNVSSPNTPGLRDLQSPASLKAILEPLQEANAALSRPKPLLVKIAPDLTETQLNELIGVCLALQVSGIVATNTTTSRQGLQTPPDELTGLGPGGISGAPLRQRATRLIARIHQHTGGQLPIVGVGGIFSGRDALEKWEAGARLVQLYTGFIYRGPSLIREVKQAYLDWLSSRQQAEPGPPEAS